MSDDGLPSAHSRPFHIWTQSAPLNVLGDVQAPILLAKRLFTCGQLVLCVAHVKGACPLRYTCYPLASEYTFARLSIPPPTDLLPSRNALLPFLRPYAGPWPTSYPAQIWRIHFYLPTPPELTLGSMPGHSHQRCPRDSTIIRPHHQRRVINQARLPTLHGPRL